MNDYCFSTTIEDRCLRIIKLIDLGKGPELIAMLCAIANYQIFLNGTRLRSDDYRRTSDDFDDLSKVYPFDGFWLKHMILDIELSDLEELLNQLNDSHPNASTEFGEFLHQLDETIPMVCPKTGEFYGYKKAYFIDWDMKETKECIVKLLIPNDAKRSSSFGRKCRCSKAKVVGVRTIDGKDVLPKTAERSTYDIKVRSEYDINFTYTLGEWAVPEYDFDENRWNECASGIHFFMTKEEAIDY